MYRKESEGWFKHTDFILIDMICLQIAFYLAYLIKGLGINPYNDLVYRNMAIVLELADLVTMFMLDMLHHVTQRGRYRELIATVGNVAAVGLLGIAYLFVMQEGEAYSRMTFGITLVLYFILSYTTRLAWKRVLASGKWDRNRRSLMIVTTKAEAKEVVETVKLNNYGKFLISGLVIVDKDMAGQSIAGVNVIANSKDAPMYVCQQWIDEVLIVVPDDKPYPEELIKKLEETGVTMHLRLSKIAAVEDRPQFVEKIGSYTVLTTSLNYASPKQLLFKRVMDIAGGLVGCLLTVIIFIFVAPVIYISSPGPIFFSQERIGKNGKKFKIYKFRSMYMDAEARKAELMKQNRVADGKMFKLDFDPRVIGNKILPDGTKKTGVGNFIRVTSLDEFPQFFNVLNDKKTEYDGICQKFVPTIERKGLAAVSSSFFAALYSAFGKYDVVHIHAEGPAFFAWLPKMFGKRVVVTIHGIDWQRKKWKSGFASKFIRYGEKNAVKYADEIIVLSKGVQNYFKNTYGRETRFIPNGVNRPEIREAELVTEKFGLTKDSYILFLGRLVPEKGIRYLIEAFKNVKTNKKLVIAGGSSDTDSFTKELKNLAKGDDRIIFTGFVQGQILGELYSNAYMYTLPSDLEGMPLSLLEAMSYGNCCLVSDIPECTEVVEDKALIFKKSDVAGLKEKLQEACDHPEKVMELKKQAADFICEKYNWDDVVEKTMKLYRGEK